MKEDLKQFALLPLSEDERDFSHDRVFGSTALADLPDGDFFASEPLEIKNQDINYTSDFCAAYAAAAVSEDQEGMALCPEYTFAKAKQLKGDFSAYGLNLRDICQAGCKFGFLAREYDPFHCETENRPDRDYLANWNNWPGDLDMLAWEHAKNSFFKVDGPYDTFDNFRSVLYKNASEQRSILTGALWRESWKDARGAYVDVGSYDESERGNGHAFKVFGWMQAKGKTWLVAQLSDGVENGDKGIYYFSREVVNKEFVFGAFTFKDMSKETAAVSHEYGFKPTDGFWQKAVKIIMYVLNK